MKRAGLVALAIVVALAGAVGLIAFFQSRDDASLNHDEGNAPGVAAPDLTREELALGNVVLTYRSSGERPLLQSLGEDIAGPPDQTLEDAGQAVIVHARPSGGGGVVAEAYERRLEVPTAADPRLREFVEYWLGRGRAG